MTDVSRELTVAVEACRTAARACIAARRDIAGGTLHKDDRSPVTVADFAGQALVCRALERAFPADPIVAEETTAALRHPDHSALLARIVDLVRAEEPDADADAVRAWIDRGGPTSAAADRFWTLDPIDGTKGYLRGDHYAVALALIERGRVVVGVLACPMMAPPQGAEGSGVLFAASRGGGTTAMPLLGGGPGAPVRVSATADPRQARLVEPVELGHSHHSTVTASARLLGMRRRPLRMDSQAKYAAVAQGGADVYLRVPGSPSPRRREQIWDHAAGCLVVVEAGGRVTDALGRELDFGEGSRLESAWGIAATNGALHESVIDAIGRVTGGEASSQGRGGTGAGQ